MAENNASPQMANELRAEMEQKANETAPNVTGSIHWATATWDGVARPTDQTDERFRAGLLKVAY
jgi:hypothetical protein